MQPTPASVRPGASVQKDGRNGRAVTVAAVVVAVVGSLFATAQASAAVKSQVRGFDGTTIKVGSLGNASQVGTSKVGAEARIKRFNDDTEIKGVKLEYVGFADDKGDPATALSEARKLVTQDQVFALVGDTSNYNPAEYFTQQKVPFFGWGYETAYCAPKPTTSLWGFGYNGCQVNPNPTVVVDFANQVYEYVTQKLGKKHPTVAMVALDTDAGKVTVNQNDIAYKRSGFDVVSAKGSIPPPPVGDYSPYVAQLMTADNGSEPDVVTCLVGLQCLNIYNLMSAQGFKGIFQHALYTDIFVKAFADTIVTASNANFNATGIPSLDQMNADIAAVAPDQKMDGVVFSGYSSTDMFIQALKTAAKSGKSAITPTNVQKIAAKQTWQLKGLTGPIVFPIATNVQEPYCTSLFESDGTTWNTAEPYSCSTKTYPVKGTK
jgi:ABC-type branched-subunit amino acid transport system substrate-binding protein